MLPKDVHDQIVQLVLRTKQDSPLLIAIAVVGMVWTASGAVGVTLQKNFSSIIPNAATPSDQVSDAIVSTLRSQKALGCAKLG